MEGIFAAAVAYLEDNLPVDSPSLKFLLLSLSSLLISHNEMRIKYFNRTDNSFRFIRIVGKAGQVDAVTM